MVLLVHIIPWYGFCKTHLYRHCGFSLAKTEVGLQTRRYEHLAKSFGQKVCNPSGLNCRHFRKKDFLSIAATKFPQVRMS